MKNQANWDFKSNPALASIFAGKKVGDSVKLELTLKVMEINEQNGTASTSIKEVCDCADEEKVAEPSADEPMMMTMGDSDAYHSSDE